MLAWWFFSIVNVAVSVCTLQTSNPLRRHPTLFFSLEIFAAIAFPIGCILAVFATIQDGPRYSIPGVVIVVCAPPINTFFYTFVVPIQVIVTVGIIISYITVVRLQRVNKSTIQICISFYLFLFRIRCPIRSGLRWIPIKRGETKSTKSLTISNVVFYFTSYFIPFSWLLWPVQLATS